MQNLAQIAIQQLAIPNREKYSFDINYHGKFNSYNGNVRLRNNEITFNLSRKWKTIDKDIQIGLIQELALKLFKIKNNKTLNMDLYNLFIKNVHIAVPKTLNDPILENSFEKLNEQFFNNTLERPNLTWGSSSTTKLGSYEYGSDTITISSILKNANQHLLDYVMYHEMLHKKHKFNNKNGRSLHHSPQFKNDERKFPGHENAEKDLQMLCRKNKIRNWFSF